VIVKQHPLLEPLKQTIESPKALTN
jgi:hypothetical protein